MSAQVGQFEQFDFTARTRKDPWFVRISTLVSVSVMWFWSCRTVTSGVTERADALLQDYLHRTAQTFAATRDALPEPWVPGQFTVYSLISDRGTVLDRVSIKRRRGDEVRVAIDRLGAGTQLRVSLTFAHQPTRIEDLAALVAESWVKRGDGPDIHTLGAAPVDVLSLAAETLLSPAEGGGDEIIVVPAGRFEGCRGGTHSVVPISQVVRRQRGGEVRELLEFGDDNGGALF
jgi:hypothetical protein